MTQGAAEDLWHLSIDDLFVTPVETPPLEGPGPFVINLSASTAPIGIAPTGLAGFEKFKLYQVSRKEDGRDRFPRRVDGNSAICQRGKALRYLHALLQGDDRRGTPQTERPMVSTLHQGARLRDLF